MALEMVRLMMKRYVQRLRRMVEARQNQKKRLGAMGGMDGKALRIAQESQGPFTQLLRRPQAATTGNNDF